MNSLKLPDNAVLLPIDMQQAFDAAPWPPRWNDRVDENGLALLAAWRAAKRPIIHVRHDSVEDGSTLRPDRPGNAFRAGFGPKGEEPLVTKSVNAAFIGTDLDLRLRRLGANTVVLFGISTDMCVSTSVRVGANMGYRMILVEDACDCFDLPDGAGGVVPARDIHRAHVATLRAEFASVVTTGELLATLGPAVAA
ncbi:MULTISPECIES: isochorismatase family protein [Sinorhizobium]|uniref:Isochorismatase family protein n=1 Tax=Sinorhizobium psoraleae TaxID=520838 RepID=A0ABT4KJD2_9HYPH|nr:MULTISPECIES: isochorismatase family protein [Sinorhizobium]MCZ4092058.1 isochorismatase family protein [Sinorhizobium psoraleae]MDK1387115.1 isochorismatase family protein [Sinorhizobium sp. 7-81]